jgi:hypothetical protein
MNKEKFRLPFEVKQIRRRPGQSAGEHWRALENKNSEELLFFWLLGAIYLIMPLVDYVGAKYSISLGIFLFIGMVALGLWRFFSKRHDIRTWQLGENGEQYVGQILEVEMRPLGYEVFHDIQIEKAGRKMNIDHVLVGPNGVYLIETKAWRKPEKARPYIEYKQGVLYKAGVKVSDKPIREALGLAKEAHRLFHDITGRSYYVKPILVFAGWYHNVKMTHDSPILFLNETSISSFLPKHSPRNIPSKEDLDLLKAKLATL